MNCSAVGVRHNEAQIRRKVEHVLGYLTDDRLKLLRFFLFSVFVRYSSLPNFNISAQEFFNSTRKRRRVAERPEKHIE